MIFYLSKLAMNRNIITVEGVCQSELHFLGGNHFFLIKFKSHFMNPYPKRFRKDPEGGHRK